MSETHAHDGVRSSASRPVLMWMVEGDESHVKANLREAGEFLGVTPEAVDAAIVSGEPLRGWFVDWQPAGAGNS